MTLPFTNRLVRATHVTSAYPDLHPLATLPADALAPPAAPPPTFAEEARYLLEGGVGETSPRMFCAVLPNTLYHPTANVLAAGRGRILLDSDNVWREWPGVPIQQRYYWRDQFLRPTRRLKGTTLALRSPANNYYHTVADNLPRLFWLHQQALRGVPVQVLVPGPLRPWEAFYLPRLLPQTARVTTVDPAALWTSDAPLFGSYLVHSLAGHLPRHYLDFFLPHFLPRRASRRNRRIYITRRQAPGGRRILNEPDLVRTLEGYGFTPYALENLDIPSQIELFYDAEAVVAPHGAGLTNLLFAQDIDVVELHPTQAVMPHYYYLSRSLGHRYHPLSSNESGRNSSFEVDLKSLARVLDQTRFVQAGGNTWR